MRNGAEATCEEAVDMMREHPALSSLLKVAQHSASSASIMAVSSIWIFDEI